MEKNLDVFIILSLGGLLAFQQYGLRGGGRGSGSQCVSRRGLVLMGFAVCLLFSATAMAGLGL